MPLGPGTSRRGRVMGVRRWPIWGLAPGLRTYIIVVLFAYLITIGPAARVGLGSGRDLALLAALVACSAATIEVTRRTGDSAGAGKDIQAVWALPIAVLLPPIYALTVPILRMALEQWRIRRVPLHRRAFTAAVIGLSYGIGSLAFHTVTGSALASAVAPGNHTAAWISAVALAGVLQWGVNVGMMLPPWKASFFNTRAPTVIYTFPYTTLYRRTL